MVELTSMIFGLWIQVLFSTNIHRIEFRLIQNSDTWEWNQIQTQGDPPDVRSGHTMVNLGMKIFVVAGCGATTNFLNDVIVLDRSNF